MFRAVIQFCSTAVFIFVTSSCLAGIDHTLYYKGILHYTDLTGHAAVPPDQLFILKKEILPTKNSFIETATLPDYSGKMADLTTTVQVRGNTVFAQSADGSAVGTGTIQGVGPDGDFTYLNIDFVITASGASVKNINYITPTKLIARKEIDSPSGSPVMLWESDMEMISAPDYSTLYSNLHSGK